MIEARRTQLSFAEGLIAEEVTDLWEDWMQRRLKIPQIAGRKFPSPG